MSTFYRDADGDGHGNPSSSTSACSAPSGYVANSSDCDDGDAYRYPGNFERWDIRDNDCDNVQDNLGLTRWNRYFRAWSANDWEHRFATSTPSGFTSDGHWVQLYPTDVCSNSTYRPQDTCTLGSGFGGSGTTITMRHGTLVALSECSGTLGTRRVSLYLSEESGEYDDYKRNGPLTCRRIGYVYGGSTYTNVVGAVGVRRHQSGFGTGSTERGDVMWSTVANEGVPDYADRGVAWWTRAGF